MREHLLRKWRHQCAYCGVRGVPLQIEHIIIKDVTSGEKLLEITPRKLVRVARPTQGWMIIRQPILDRIRKEGGASSPS